MKRLIFIGPPIVAKIVLEPEPKIRSFLVIAYDESCNVQLDIDEPWMSDEAIGCRLSGREGTDLLMAGVARHLRAGGAVGQQASR